MSQIVIQEHFYTASQAAEALGVERHTISRWIKEGKLEGQRVGTAILISRTSVGVLALEMKGTTKLGRPAKAS